MLQESLFRTSSHHGWHVNPNESTSMKRLLCHSLLGTLLTLFAVASYGQPATPITSLPFTISSPGKYILQSDLTAASGDGISVGASYVRIDMGGFTITSTALPNSAAGIKVDGVHDVEVKNGAINGFSVAVSMSNLPGGTGSGYVVDNIRALVLDEGIIFRGCKDSLISNCLISKDNLSRFSDAAGIRLFRCRGIRVLNNTITAGASSFVPYPVGIFSGTSNGSYFENDYIVNCQTAMILSPPDKYRAITTENCPNGIEGGNDIDNQSN
jgi:hypothetical protein